MKALTPYQQELASKRRIKPIPLVILRTYTSKPSVVDRVHYFSDRAVSYDYGGTGTVRHFLPVVQALDPLVRRMPYLATTGDFAQGVTQPITIGMRNGAIDGASSLWRSFQKTELIDSGNSGGTPASVFEFLASSVYPATAKARHRLVLTSGKGAGQERIIRQISDASAIAKIQSAWEETPDLTTTYEIWRDERIEGAEIEIADLLVRPDALPTDVRRLAGDEHLVFYRGDVEYVRDITEETMTLEISQTSLSMNLWPLSGSAPVDPADRGKYANYVYGDVRRIPAQGVEVGAVSLLAVGMSDADTVAYVDNIDEWPDSGNGWVGMEPITWAGRDLGDGALTGITRAASPVAHPGGSIVSEELTEALWAIGVHPMHAITSVYARNALDGNLLRLSPGTHYTVNENDSRPEVPFPWSSIAINPTQMAFLKAEFEAQAEWEETGATGPTIQKQDFTQIDGESDVTNLGRGSGGNFEDFHRGFANELVAGSQYEVREPDSALPTEPRPCVVSSISGLPGGGNRVSQWRVKITADVFSAPGRNNQARFRLYNAPSNSEDPPIDATLHEMTITAPQGGFITETKYSRWFEGTGNLRPSDFNNASLSYSGFFLAMFQRYQQDTGQQYDSDHHAQVQVSQIEFEWIDSTAPGLVSRTADANTLTRISGGQGLRLFADGVGYEAPDGTYSVAQGEPIENIPDILRHMIVERANLPASSIDATSWAKALALIGNEKVGFVTSDYETTWVGQIGQMLYENRCRLLAEENNDGYLFRLVVAEKIEDGLFVYDRSGREITKWENSAEDTRDLERIYTRWRWHSDPNRAQLGFRQPGDTFERVITIDQAGSDIESIIPNADRVALEDEIGARDAAPQYLVSPREAAWADEVAEFYIRETWRLPAATVALTGVPWSQAFDLEMGDVFDVRLSSWPDKRSFMILGYVKNWDTGLIDLVGIEVNTK